MTCAGHFWQAGRRVLHGKQRSREAAEVMPGFRLWIAIDQQFVAFPMRRNNHDGLGSGQLCGQTLQRRAALAGFQRKHR
jgi:hypothetical protein